MLLLLLCLLAVHPKPYAEGWSDDDPAITQASHSDDNSKIAREQQHSEMTTSNSLETSTAPILSLHSLPMEFSLFESRMKSFIEYVKRDQLATIANMKLFIDEVDQYVVKLPSKNTYTVTEREVCHCDGDIRRPCPYQCIYSCYHYVNGAWRYEEDCRGSYSEDYCKCNVDGRVNCRHNLTICLNQTTVQPYKNVDKYCAQYSIDKRGLVKSFELIQSLMMEPLKIHFRCVESRLTFLRKASISISSLSKITDQTIKEQTDPTYATDSQFLLDSEKKKFRQMKINITLEMIKTQSEIDSFARNVDRMKEEAFAKINRSIREYSCCLKNHDRDFAVDNYDCSGVGAQSTGTPDEDAETLNRIMAKYENPKWKPTENEVTQLKSVIDILSNKLNED